MQIKSDSSLIDFIFSLPYFETSAATGQNVTKAIECLLDRVMLRMEESIDKNAADKKRVELDEAQEERKSGCAC